jgi:predicted small lipoprotein YifL
VRRLQLLLAALVAAALAACGAPAELPNADGVALDLARDRAIAAVETEQRLSGSPEAADRLLARVRKVVASGALEARQLDEFGLAALGELRLAAPSLVIVDRLEVPRELDRDALTAFLADATTDPAAATRPAAASETARIVEVIERSDAGPDSEIPVVEMTIDVYLADLAARLRPIWPDLAADLSAARSEL